MSLTTKTFNDFNINCYPSNTDCLVGVCGDGSAEFKAPVRVVSPFTADDNCNIVQRDTFNSVSGYYSAVLSGRYNTASGYYTVVTGGYGSYNNGGCSTVSGYYNSNSSYGSSITGRNNSICYWADNSVVNGEYNSICTQNSWTNSYYSNILGGYDNRICSSNYQYGSNSCTSGSSIVGGSYNYITARADYGNYISNCNSTIGGGYDNGIEACAYSPYNDSTDGIYTCADASVISGGLYNNITASGCYVCAYGQTIGGGYENCIDICGDYLCATANTVSGGYGNCITTYSGYCNNAYDECISTNTISGGYYNTIYRGSHSTISGGYENSTCGYISTVSGGANNTAKWGSTVSGGYSNNTEGYISTISGGYSNYAGGCGDVIGGGINNSTYSGYGYRDTNTISGGCNNIASAEYGGATVGGGHDNYATGNWNPTVGGGSRNCATGSNTVVAGGRGNRATGKWAAVLGGVCNTASGYKSSILGGIYNDSCGYDNTHIIGSNICANKADTTFVNNLVSLGNVQALQGAGWGSAGYTFGPDEGGADTGLFSINPEGGNNDSFLSIVSDTCTVLQASHQGVDFIRMKSPNGAMFKVTVTNTGSLSAAAL